MAIDYNSIFCLEKRALCVAGTGKVVGILQCRLHRERSFDELVLLFRNYRSGDTLRREELYIYSRASHVTHVGYEPRNNSIVLSRVNLFIKSLSCEPRQPDDCGSLVDIWVS